MAKLNLKAWIDGMKAGIVKAVPVAKITTQVVADVSVDTAIHLGGLIQDASNSVKTRINQASEKVQNKNKLQSITPEQLAVIKQMLVNEHQDNNPNASIQESIDYVAPYLEKIPSREQILSK